MATVKLVISGDGGEFQHHFLSKAELKDILKIAKKGDADSVVDEYFGGGKMFENTNYAGAYGCDINASFTANGKKFKPANFVLEQRIDDAKPFADGGNLYYITKASVSAEVEFEVDGKFDPKLLEIYYVDYEILEGWKSGKIISQIHYNGEEVFADVTDDGSEHEHIGCVYQVDKKGLYKETDIFLMRDEEEWKFDSDVISNFLKK
jgi:hypothetical protein